MKTTRRKRWREKLNDEKDLPKVIRMTGRMRSSWGTGTCAIAPCRVYFEMPPGDGDYRVRGIGFDYGTYRAGRTVNLGDFYDAISIEVIGAGVPKAYVYIPVYR